MGKSFVWNYTVKINCSEAKCKICGTVIKHKSNTTNILKHLKRYHSTLKEVQALLLQEQQQTQGQEQNHKKSGTGRSKTRTGLESSESETEVDDDVQPILISGNSSETITLHNNDGETVILSNVEDSVFNTSTKRKSAGNQNNSISIQVSATKNHHSPDGRTLDAYFGNGIRTNNSGMSLSASNANSSSDSDALSIISELHNLSTSSKTSTPKPIRHSHANKDSQSTLSYCVKEMQSLKVGGKRNNEITNAFLFMIVQDDLPFRTSEKIGYKTFMKVAVPNYEIPSRRTIVQGLDEKYEVLFPILKEKISRVESKALTADLWTETHNQRSILGITAHYIENDVLQYRGLGGFEMDKRHTADNIADLIKDVLQMWGISIDRISAFVTDGGKNIVNAVISIVGEDKHLYCAAHTMNTALFNSVKKLNNVGSAIQITDDDTDIDFDFNDEEELDEFFEKSKDCGEGSNSNTSASKDNVEIKELSPYEKFVRNQISKVTPSSGVMVRVGNQKQNFVSIPISEVTLYLQKGFISLEMDPIMFWKVQKEHFPSLYKVATKYLAIPIISTSSERLFSVAGDIMKPRRSRLTPQHLNRLLILKSTTWDDWLM